MTTVLALLLSVTVAGPGGATLAWDANTEPNVSTYVIQVGTTAGGPYHDALYTTHTSDTVADLAAGTTYFFIVRAINAGGFWSGPSNEVRVTMPGVGAPPVDDCAPVTGRYAVSIFLTNLLKTGSGGPGSRARLLFQLASPGAPITDVAIYADGGLVSKRLQGVDLTDVPGSWFTMPASGSYTLSVTAKNNQGCTKTATYGPSLVVP
jgi:hypothetical protein